MSGGLDSFRSVDPVLCPTTQSHRVQVPFPSGYAFGNYLGTNPHLNWPSCYDLSGDFIVDGEAPRLGVDDIDWEDDSVVSALNALEDCLLAPHNLEPVVDPDVESMRVVQAVNAHFITGLNSNLASLPESPRILVLCAGDGEDLNRLDKDVLRRATSIDFIGFTRWNSRSALLHYRYRDKIRVSQNYLADWSPSGLYDLILCHHGLNNIMSTSKDSDSFVYLITNHLSPSGVFVGDYINLQGLTTRVPLYHDPNVGVRLMDYDPPDGRGPLEGVVRVRVNKAEWSDSVLTDSRLLAALSNVRLRVGLYHGRGAFNNANLVGNRLAPPSNLKHVLFRDELKVMTYVEIRRSYAPLVPPKLTIGLHPLSVDNVGDRSVVGRVHLNRGKPMQPVDYMYSMQGYSMFSEKVDGFPARGLITTGYCRVLTWDGVLLSASVPYVGPDVTFQLECTPTARIVVEPISILGQVAFSSRVAAWRTFCDTNPWVRFYFETKPWYFDYKTARDSLPPGAEGLVVMAVSAPPPDGSPMFSRLARYIKRRYTVDLSTSGRVFEYALEEGKLAVVRERPDKSKGNDAVEIALLNGAITLSDSDSLHGIPYDALDLGIKLLRKGTRPSDVWGEAPISAIALGITPLHLVPASAHSLVSRFRWATGDPGVLWDFGGAGPSECVQMSPADEELAELCVLGF